MGLHCTTGLRATLRQRFAKAVKVRVIPKNPLQSVADTYDAASRPMCSALSTTATLWEIDHGLHGLHGKDEGGFRPIRVIRVIREIRG